MALKPLSPIKTHTIEGLAVEIHVIDPKNLDCFTGTIDFPSKGKVKARWDKLGISRNKPGKYSLDMDAPELLGIIRIANEFRT